MVQAVLLALVEDAQPFVLVGGGIARLGEDAVLHRAAKEQRTPVETAMWRKPKVVS